MNRRSYRQYCALARALDIVGERWTLLIVRELRPGPRRYTDLMANLPGLGTSLLAERLHFLQTEGLIERGYLPPPAASAVYSLTDDGRELLDALTPLTLWGSKRLGNPGRGVTVNMQWVMDFMSTIADRDAARGVHETYEFRLPHGTFHVVADDGDVRFVEGEAPSAPDMVLETTMELFMGIGNGTVNPADEVREGRIKVSGSPQAAMNSLAILRPGGLDTGEAEGDPAIRQEEPATR